MKLGLRFGVSLFVPMLVACSGPNQDQSDAGAGRDGGAGSAGDSGAKHDANDFHIANHVKYPQVPYQGGPLLTHPQIVTITYANDSHRDEIESFGEFVVNSSWLARVGAQYGMMQGAQIATIRLQESAPATITDSDVQAFFAAKFEDGSLPVAATDSNYLYMLYLPGGTTATEGTSTSCKTFFGYHAEATAGSVHYPYAVIVGCGDDAFSRIPCDHSIPGDCELHLIEYAASHELLEASENPFPKTSPGFTFVDPTDPWRYFGKETADLCSGRTVQENGYTLTKNWSNAAAANDMDPCIPNESVFNYGLSPELLTVQSVAVKETVSFVAEGWTTAPLDDFYVVPQLVVGEFVPDIEATGDASNNLKKVLVTVTVPETTPSGSRALIDLVAAYSQNDYRDWPVMVVVK